MRPEPIFRTDLKNYRSLKEEIQAKHERTEFMLKKLEDQMARGFINNSFAEEFVPSIRARFNAGIPLSEKQITTLEKLFEEN